MMLFKSLALFALPLVLAAPTKQVYDDGPSNQKCKNPRIRKEWHSLSQDERDSYIKETKCLREQPTRIDSKGLVDNLYDDFTYVHYTINQTIHHVAAFFPWHRYFVHMREKALHECGYEGTMPYWDWTKDATLYKFNHSSIFDPDTGFGGNGVPQHDELDNWCVEDGPFANWKVNFPEKRCLTRHFNATDVLVTNWTLSNVQKIMKFDNYLEFWNGTERHPHDYMHDAISGDMGKQWSSNDPMFFLHHTQVDRMWTQWQGRNKTRMLDYYGNTVQGFGLGNIGVAATLDDTMYYMGLAKNHTVRDFIDTMAGEFCYTYDSWIPEGDDSYDEHNDDHNDDNNDDNNDGHNNDDHHSHDE